MLGGPKIKLDKDLFERIKKASEVAGYSSVNEFVVHILEKELALFPDVKAYMLMGDVAIKALNYISKRAGAGRVIPAGSTYKIRGEEYSFRGKRAFPSYLQVGPSFGIEKSKRNMIAEDIANALRLV